MQKEIKKSSGKLTLFIILALALGIACGFILDNTWLSQDNKIITANTQLGIVLKENLSGIKDTSSEKYISVKKKIAENAKLRGATIEAKNKKLDVFSLISDIFLRLIKMIIAPLVLCTLAAGVAKLGDLKLVGRIGGKTLLWFLCASLTSLLLGMLLVNLFQPGAGMHLALTDSIADTGIQKTAFTLREFMYHVFPTSLMDAMARNEILQIVLFATLFGIAAAAIGEKGKIVVEFLDAAGHVILKMTGYIMNLAPLAVFCAMTAVVAKQGLGILGTYSLFIGEFYLGILILWMVLILGASLFIGKDVFKLLRHIKDPVLLAFSTSSSESAFPKMLIELERYGCPDKITSFVLPLGYSFNLDGSMMYMTFASIFIAQCYGIHLDGGTQITMLLILMLTSKGVAGVPRASLVVIAGTLATFKLPEAGMALLLGIDPILDMGRAATNVLGNSIATAVVSKSEKKY